MKTVYPDDRTALMSDDQQRAPCSEREDEQSPVLFSSQHPYATARLDQQHTRRRSRRQRH